MPSETIVVRPGVPGRVYVRVPYSLARLAAIKSFPGRRWLPVEKVWSLPAAPDILDRLKSAFPEDAFDDLATPSGALPPPRARPTERSGT